MENITKIFGAIVPTFFTASKDGVSLSEVSRIQAEHKQENDKFNGMMSDATIGIFNRKISVLSAGRAAETIDGLKVTADDIKGYRGVADRNAQIAGLMFAVKTHRRLQAELERMDLQQFVADAMPVAPSRPKSAGRGTSVETDRFMEMGNIDEMIAALEPAVLSTFDLAFWKRANELNSRAAALGKLLSEQGSFFRELVKPLPRGNDQIIHNGVVVTLWERAYSPDKLTEFSRLRDELQEKYNDLQKQLNGCRKQIKDAVRAYNLGEERRYQLEYGQYRVDAERYALETERIRSAAETLRQQALQEIAALRVRTE
jgi:hypothetical protein